MASGQDVRNLVPADVTYIHATQANIGALRNIGCHAARGEYIAHFDDDDWSAPGRLQQAVAALRESGKAIYGYRSIRFTDGANWWLYTGRPTGYAVGTSLVYRRDWWQSHPFLPLQIGEDNNFVLHARKQGQIVVDDANDMMFATIHEQNTSPRQTKGKEWRKIA